MPVYISKAEVPTTELQFGKGGSYTAGLKHSFANPVSKTGVV